MFKIMMIITLRVVNVHVDSMRAKQPQSSGAEAEKSYILGRLSMFWGPCLRTRASHGPAGHMPWKPSWRAFRGCA